MFFLLTILVLLQNRDVTAAPIDDESLADQEQHDGDLGNREKAPNTGLFHQIIRDEGSSNRTKKEQEATLNDHTLLFVQCEEWGEHQERVDTSTHHIVTWVSHRDGPSQMPHGLALEGTKVGSSQPLSRWLSLQVHSVQGWNKGKEVSNKKQEAADQAQSLDNIVTICCEIYENKMTNFNQSYHLATELTLVFATLGQRSINDVAVVRLQANVQKPKKS